MRPLLGALAALAVVSLSACQDSDDDDNPRDDSTSTSQSGSTEAETGAGSAEEAEELMSSGTPPKDLLWSVPEAPSHWRELKVGTGERQWQIGETTCVVTLSQPGGLGTGPRPTSEEVAQDFATKITEATRSTPIFDATNKQLLPNAVNDIDAELTAEFATLHFTASPGDIEGQVWGHRAGDYALAAVALCGQGAYPDHHDEIEPFLQGLAARTTY